MDNSIERRDRGTEAEDRLERILASAFLVDFVARSPMGAKGGVEKEIADFLIPFRDTLVVVQVKAREVSGPESELSETEVKRLVNKLDAAAKQIKTAKRALEGEWAESVTTLRGVEQPFDLGRFKRLIGVAVLDIVQTAESEEEEALDLYSGLGEQSGVVCHSFLLRELELVLSHITTVPDFVHYLEARQKLIGGGKGILIEERNFLGMFIAKHNELVSVLEDENALLLVDENLWEDLNETKEEEFARRGQLLDLSRTVFDKMLERLHESIGYQVPLWQGVEAERLPPGTPESYLVVLETLAGLMRSQRTEFSMKMLEKIDGVTVDCPIRSFVMQPSQDETWIYFQASSDERDVRVASLTAHASALCIHLGREAVLGVATGSGSSAGRVYDFVRIEAGAEFEDEDSLRGLVSEKAIENLYNKSSDEWGNQFES